MAPWELHERYPSLDIKNAPGYPNHYSPYWLDDCPKFDDDPSLTIAHVMKFLKHASEIRLLHEYSLTILFFLWEPDKRIGLGNLLVQRTYLLSQSSLKNFSNVGPKELKGMNIFFTILWYPFKKKDTLLTLFKKIKY